jgi:hypothetical protein
LRRQVTAAFLEHHSVAIAIATHHSHTSAPAAHGHSVPHNASAAATHNLQRRSSIKPEIGDFYCHHHLISSKCRLVTPFFPPLTVAKIAARRGSIDPSKASAAAAAHGTDHSTSDVKGVGFLSMTSFDPNTSLRNIFHAPEVVRSGVLGLREGWRVCCCLICVLLL